MRMLFYAAVLLFVWHTPVQSQEDPFSISAAREGADTLEIHFKIEPGHYLYADMISVGADRGVQMSVVNLPPPKKRLDPFSGIQRGVYEQDFMAVYKIASAKGRSFNVGVGYQGCSKALCFLPESVTFVVEPDGTVRIAGDVSEVEAGEGSDDWRELISDFTVVAKDFGYLKKKDFLCFLELAEGRDKDVPCRTANRLEQTSVWLSVLLILLGGLALNLTPCVLPMIPINIAIIGAGAQAGSKRRGFALGGAYGAAIALTYGALGLVVVLTKSKFGALNATPWFNAMIAVVFTVLALAMFGVITIDFSRLQGKVQVDQAKRGHYWVALFMGAVAALLAGACVAPVVFMALTLAADLYGEGSTLGLLLPFVLGVGMGLPWPFAGAGLSFLPKPGRWMEWVKYGFGVIILGFAIYYGYEAYRLFGDEEITHQAGWHSSLSDALKAGREEKKPVFIDFYASWCKNCVAMEKTTLRDEEVAAALTDYVKLKYTAEKPNEPATKEVLDHFGAIGLPTYVVLAPNEGSQSSP